MLTKVVCPFCKHSFSVIDSLMGKKSVECPNCEKWFTPPPMPWIAGRPQTINGWKAGLGIALLVASCGWFWVGIIAFISAMEIHNIGSLPSAVVGTLAAAVLAPLSIGLTMATVGGMLVKSAHLV